MTKKRTNFGLQPLEKNLDNVLKPIFDGSRKEFALVNNLSKNWEDVIGKKYSKFCYPKSVTFPKKKHAKPKLTIGVYNPSVGFFLEQNTEIILERIASFYGFRSIERIIIKQEPKELEVRVDIDQITIPKKKQEFLDNTLKGVEDKELAKILERLGKVVFS
ncbi:MAG: DUF721 domain-containing protein [Rickettsiales bacterium]|nr:DUF721 domain-containing protein [Rickettsiales bacterium]